MIHLTLALHLQYLRSGMPFTKNIKNFQFKDILP